MTDDRDREDRPGLGADEPAGLPALPVTWRPLRTRVVAYTVAALVLVAITVIAVALPSGGATPWHVADRIVFESIGVAVAATLWILARPRVTAARDGLTVVNMVRTRHLDWAQIVAVNLRAGDPWVLLDLDDGDVMAVMGIQASGGPTARRQVDELRALIDEFCRTERND
jgi:hypothetical protein